MTNEEIQKENKVLRTIIDITLELLERERQSPIVYGHRIDTLIKKIKDSLHSLPPEINRPRWHWIQYGDYPTETGEEYLVTFNGDVWLATYDGENWYEADSDEPLGWIDGWHELPELPSEYPSGLWKTTDVS